MASEQEYWGSATGHIDEILSTNELPDCCRRSSADKSPLEIGDFGCPVCGATWIKIAKLPDGKWEEVLNAEARGEG